MNAIAAAILRERAVIAGIAIAALQAAANGEITRETAVPVLAGIILRFFVTPYDRAAIRRPDRADHQAHGDPDTFHA